MGIIYLILSYTVKDFSLDGKDVFTSILSTYLLAFVHAGSSVFNQIEHWSIMKSLFFHFTTLYTVYVGCYLINSWIPFNILVVATFTIIFVVTYFIIWLTVYLCVKSASKKMSRKIV
ncbi:MAG: DUF3021 domain-containing protein [Clostridia bacterium]|nr:DUF3021 domain-containing protein [Clostridia bacterium]